VSGPFLGMTVLFALAAIAMGRALAAHWRAPRQVILYAFLLALGHRFLLYALYDEELLSPAGFLTAALILAAVGFLAYRWAQAALMVRQYPWLYRRAGPFAWRQK
jgi:hypothetical protein